MREVGDESGEGGEGLLPHRQGRIHTPLMQGQGILKIHVYSCEFEHCHKLQIKQGMYCTCTPYIMYMYMYIHVYLRILRKQLFIRIQGMYNARLCRCCSCPV